jgi:transcriptional regulator with XRE-family HTH domain
MNTGKAIKTIREENGLSRPDLAKRVGITPASIWKIEAGKTQAKTETIERVCSSLKVPLARFYTLALEPRDFGLI